ncbi:selenocysteine-specific translation elongation factor [Georgenia sp. SYP-B2076]|uniref:selenocysteine-specific translation elongation factor n=1 Tax=Georgenia sp. SYP-B2076 TaxID=2495881 RepID=UPI000F8C68CE|nr:selenocysteine-specific translation elongation factor [Georgenia sp. SYP-B2076]
MHVVATAGHVDHGKSTLVKALTGADPDRLAEEHRRGLSIELGYCWTALPPAGDVAFVDVPGHERFLATMLSGIGPVPAVLFVVAADDPWMPQAAEHLAALDALGVTHGVLAVTRSDLADPAPARERALAELGRTSLRGAAAVTVSGRTGQGLDELRSRLLEMLGSLPVPGADADVRLWVDRRFSVRGAGTVVTGTLPAGRVAVGDTLALGDRAVRVRGVQSLGRPVAEARGVARVALNVAGEDLAGLDRGSVLVTPGAWHLTDVVDVRVGAPADLGPCRRPVPPESPLLHIGATAVATHHRPLGGDLARLTLDARLPLRVGDRAVLRDPGSRALWGVTVLDPAPPPLRRRGAAAQRAEVLAGEGGGDRAGDGGDLAAEVRRREVVPLALLRRIGVPTGDAQAAGVVAGGWVMSHDRARRAGEEAARVVDAHDRGAPLDRGVPVAVLAAALGLPSADLVRAVLRPPLRLSEGRVTAGVPHADLPPGVERAVATLERDLRASPFAAPTADRLRELGLDERALAAAARSGRLLRVAPGIVLRAGADAVAAAWLAELPQPFTTSEARRRLGTTRRVVLPLLERLDRLGLTRRLPDDRRQVGSAPGGG